MKVQKSVSCFYIPATFLPLINCRRQTIAQIIFPRQGNTAWINSITWYSPSSECGQFNRRSVPFFFFYSRDNLVTSLLSPSRTGGDKQNRRARKCLCWHCVWTSQGELIPGVGQGGYYANLIATASSRTFVDLVFHVFSVIICCQQLYQGGCSNWYGCGCTLGRKVWCICVGVTTNHLLSSFYMQRCHSQLQINLLQGNYSQTYFNRIRSVFSIYIVKKILSCCFTFIASVCFPRPTVKIESTTTKHLHQIFPILMFIVLVHSVCLFLVKRQLHKMVLRSMRRLGRMILWLSSQQSYSFPRSTK